jgi:hypothetical protein
MFGAVLKSYYAQKEGIDPAKIYVVSVMPCTAKKFESTRPEMKSDVDYVLTTRETAKLIRHFKIDFKNLKDEDFDPHDSWVVRTIRRIVPVSKDHEHGKFFTRHNGKRAVTILFVALIVVKQFDIFHSTNF